MTILYFFIIGIFSVFAGKVWYDLSYGSLWQSVFIAISVAVMIAGILNVGSGIKL